MLGTMEVAGLPTNAAEDVASGGLRVITLEPPVPEIIEVHGLKWTSRTVWWLGRHAPLVTAVLCSMVAVVGFRGGDYPAQDYRAFMFGAHGFLIWDVNWYGGHALLGYSVLFPAVGWILGTVPATAIACTASTALFGRLIGRADNWPAVVARLWFAVFVVGDLIVGRAPFACAVTAGLGAVLAVRARHAWLGTAAAIIASLFSPLGAAFLLLVAVAWAPTLGWRRAAPFAGVFAGLAGVLPGFGPFAPCDWGLGVEIRGTKQPHWTGTSNSPATFGHFGRSGSFLWIDPVAGVLCGGLCDRPFGPWAARSWPVLADAVVAEWRLTRPTGPEHR